MATDVMLHLVFTYSLQELLPDLNNSWAPASRQAELQFYLAWLDVIVLTPPVTSHHPVPTVLLEPCFCPGSDPSLDLELVPIQQQRFVLFL